MPYNSFFNWSGGKDSALALYYVLQNSNYRIRQLVTTVNQKYCRISMHGVRTELLMQQAKSIGIPLQQLLLSGEPSMDEYNSVMNDMLEDMQRHQITHAVFGDIFLEDLKQYRERQLVQKNITAYFPLWKRNTTELANEFIQLGFKAIVVCVNTNVLDESFAGRIIDNDFLKDLPPGIDPCGENGEFHSFVFDGPIFQTPVSFNIKEKVLRNYSLSADKKEDSSLSLSNIEFCFCDLVP